MTEYLECIAAARDRSAESVRVTLNSGIHVVRGKNAGTRPAMASPLKSSAQRFHFFTWTHRAGVGLIPRAWDGVAFTLSMHYCHQKHKWRAVRVYSRLDCRDSFPWFPVPSPCGGFFVTGEEAPKFSKQFRRFLGRLSTTSKIIWVSHTDIVSAFYWTMLTLCLSCPGLCWHYVCFVLDYADIVSALSWTMLTFCLRCPGICWHCACIVLDYADIVPDASSWTMLTSCLCCPGLSWPCICVVLDYADIASALSWTMLTLCLRCPGLCWYREKALIFLESSCSHWICIGSQGQRWQAFLRLFPRNYNNLPNLFSPLIGCPQFFLLQSSKGQRLLTLSF